MALAGAGLGALATSPYASIAAAGGHPEAAGAGPDVLDAVLEIAAAVGRTPARRQSARALLERTLEDAAAGEMSRERRAVLEDKARRIAEALGHEIALPPLWRG